MSQFTNNCDEKKELELSPESSLESSLESSFDSSLEQSFESSLEPSLESSSSESLDDGLDDEYVENICNNFISLFKKHFKFNAERVGDKFESDGKKIMVENIKFWVNLKKPICCCLPAFPVKSPSLEKVFGIYPDYGEYLALQQLYLFANDVNKFYKYGCKMLIIADGRVYGDLIAGKTEHVKLYKEEIVKMIKDNGFDKNLDFTNLAMELNYDDTTDIDDKPGNMDLINLFLNQYGDGFDYKQICKNIKNNKNLQTVHFGMWKFLEYDGAPWNTKQFKSVKSVQKNCRETAKRMMIRSNAYSNLIRAHYPNYVRFSIHAHDNSTKFAVCLFKNFGINHCITPWHNVVCKMLDGRILLIKHIIVKLIIAINEERENLRIGSKLSIYSKTEQIWYDDAVINKIEYIQSNDGKLADDEWLIIGYNNNQNTMKIQRFSDCIKPIDQQQDDDEQEKMEQHLIDIKHGKQYKKIALQFNEWTKNKDSMKSFNIIYKDNKKWCYQEV